MKYQTRDLSPRCLEDVFLRRHGFKILSRPAQGESWWIKDGIAYTRSEALLRVMPQPVDGLERAREVVFGEGVSDAG